LTDSSDQTQHNLRERIKELTALHRTAKILQDHERPVGDVLRDMVNFLPEAWQYPEITGARICFENIEATTPNFMSTSWLQKGTFIVGKARGTIEICYRESRPQMVEGPFLAEERNLIDSIAEMLRMYFQHRQADEALSQAQATLEKQVKERTADLEKTNAVLHEQIEEQKRAAQQIREYQKQLKRLTLELSLTEERERREIAGDLHDHIGQALAFVKIKVSQLQGNAVFCGFEDTIGEIIALLDQTIAYTRNLTLQISPPVLYEFGLAAAIDWLAEHFQKEYDLTVKTEHLSSCEKIPNEQAIVLFKSVKELLTNAVRHSHATAVKITTLDDDNCIKIQVADNGQGFDATRVFERIIEHSRFGLFSVRERMRSLGGNMTISSAPSRGTDIELTVPLANRGENE